MRTICVYHSRDLDGWMSAAIVKKWFIDETHSDNKLFSICTYEHRNDDVRGTNHEHLDMLGFDYGDNIPDLSEYNRVIMCDISFPKEKMADLSNELGVNFIWIDHHQRTVNEVNEYIINHGSCMEGLVTEEGELKAACELTWEYFYPEGKMPEIVRLLGRYDCFGHKQQWKHVVGYEGYYEVSNQGSVRSLDRVITEKNIGIDRSVKGKDLSIANSKRGYRVVNLCIAGNENMRNVHQLVAESFVPNPEGKPCVNHKDLNRLNNNVSNLEWVTYGENNSHSIRLGSRCKSVLQMDVNEIFINRFESIKDAEEKTGILNQNISKVCKGERKNAGGFKWEYGVNSPKVKQFVPESEELTVLTFQYGARAYISNYEEAYRYLQSDAINMMMTAGHGIYSYLCTEAGHIMKKTFTLELHEPGISKDRVFLCVNHERFNPINFGIDYHKDGYDGFACFWFKDGNWSFSLYNDNGEVDCSKIAGEYGGGGHKGASGFVVKDLSKTIETHQES